MSNDVGIAIAWRRLVACGVLVVAGICGLGAQAGEAPGAASYCGGRGMIALSSVS